MKYLDLFSGIGGFPLGAYNAGWRFDEHYFSEVDKYAIEGYRQRFPDAIPLGDIKKINTKTLANTINTKATRQQQDSGQVLSITESERLDVGGWFITGGFPCQDISTAGKGEGIGGSRSGLWFEMWRIIRALQPRWVIAENVGAITFRGLSTVVNSLAEIGYDCEWQDIRASDMGAPHRRERIWIVAYPESVHAQGHGNRQRQEQSGGSSRWPVEPAVGELVDGLSNGLDRYQGRVATKSFKRVDQLKCLGNSIIPQIAELLFRQIGVSAEGQINGRT